MVKERKYKLVIFDLDGTLMNTSPGIFESANKTREAMGLSREEDLSVMSRFIGPPIKDCFRVTYNMTDEKQIEEAVTIFRGFYTSHGMYQAVPFQGMKDTLKSLKDQGYLLAVGTMKHGSTAKAMMTHFGFDPYFDEVAGSDEHGVLTKGLIVQSLCEQFGVLPSEAVLVGDTMHDALGAEFAHVDFIAAQYGFGFPDGVEVGKGIDAVIAQPLDLLPLLRAE